MYTAYGIIKYYAIDVKKLLITLEFRKLTKTREVRIKVKQKETTKT